MLARQGGRITTRGFRQLGVVGIINRAGFLGQPRDRLAVRTALSSNQELLATTSAPVPANYLGTNWAYADIDPNVLLTPGTSFRVEMWIDDGAGGWQLDCYVTADTGPHHLIGRNGNPLKVPITVGVGVSPGRLGADGTLHHDHAGKQIRTRFVADTNFTAGLLQERG